MECGNLINQKVETVSLPGMPPVPPQHGEIAAVYVGGYQLRAVVVVDGTGEILDRSITELKMV